MSVIVELDYRPKLSAIRDQGPRPTCLAFATTAVHEYARQSKEPLSPEYLHYFASEKGTLVGAAVSDVAWALNKEGQTSEVVCPYRRGDGGDHGQIDRSVGGRVMKTTSTTGDMVRRLAEPQCADGKAPFSVL